MIVFSWFFNYMLFGIWGEMIVKGNLYSLLCLCPVVCIGAQSVAKRYKVLLDCGINNLRFKIENSSISGDKEEKLIEMNNVK
jgi:hypothetical protein